MLCVVATSGPVGRRIRLGECPVDLESLLKMALKRSRKVKKVTANVKHCPVVVDPWHPNA